jgi:hypothetical protein
LFRTDYNKPSGLGCEAPDLVRDGLVAVFGEEKGDRAMKTQALILHTLREFIAYNFLLQGLGCHRIESGVDGANTTIVKKPLFHGSPLGYKN